MKSMLIRQRRPSFKVTEDVRISVNTCSHCCGFCSCVDKFPLHCNCVAIFINNPQGRCHTPIHSCNIWLQQACGHPVYVRICIVSSNIPSRLHPIEIHAEAGCSVCAGHDWSGATACCIETSAIAERTCGTDVIASGFCVARRAC